MNKNKVVGFSLSSAPFRLLSGLIACLIQEKPGCIITLPGENMVIRNKEDLESKNIVNDFMVSDFYREGDVALIRKVSENEYAVSTGKDSEAGEKYLLMGELLMAL